jgi:hypothetical protein
MLLALVITLHVLILVRNLSPWMLSWPGSNFASFLLHMKRVLSARTLVYPVLLNIVCVVACVWRGGVWRNRVADDARGLFLMKLVR